MSSTPLPQRLGGSSFPVLQGAAPIAIAHRGGAWEGPENSERAFRHCVDLGFSFIETDVRATSDGVAVIFHDASLDRSTDQMGVIRDMTWQQVSRARIHGREPIQRLDEVLTRFPLTRFNIDVKEENAIVPFLDVVRRTGAWSRICAASFGHDRLAKVRRMGGSRLASSLSPREIIRLHMRSRGIRLRWHEPAAACVQVPILMGGFRFDDPRFLAAAHSRGWQVHFWTIDDEPTITRLLDLGADAIMTDRPSLLRKVLRDRGEWPEA